MTKQYAYLKLLTLVSSFVIENVNMLPQKILVGTYLSIRYEYKVIVEEKGVQRR